MTSSMDLSYYVAEKNGVCIVSLVGNIQRGAEPVLQKIQDELSRKSCTWILLSFRDVEDVERPMTMHLAKLWKQLRDRPAKLLLCSLHPDLKKMLDHSGVLRHDEVRANLTEAVQGIVAEAGSKAAA